MRRTILPTAAILLAGLAACGPSDKPTPVDTQKASSSAAAGAPLTAQSAFQKIAASVSSAKLSGAVTADNDPNHLLGRPGQYTSKVTFPDSRVKAADAEGAKPGDVDRGGAVEVFADPADAATRAQYLQAVTKSMPALAEYDFVHATVLVRVSH
ncbi:hypothetical protein [Streptomyces sp. NPDC002078]